MRSGTRQAFRYPRKHVASCVAERVKRFVTLEGTWHPPEKALAMFSNWSIFWLGCWASAAFSLPPDQPSSAEPTFQVQEIDRGLKIGYAVIAVDIDGDQWLDLVVADQHQIAWYRNPQKRGDDWAKFILLDGQTRPDNVSIAAIDIVGDGQAELVVGAGWQPFNTTLPGQLVWLQRGTDVTQPWTMHELPCNEPTVHRVRCIDLDGDGFSEIVHVPLMGAGSTRENNWSDGRPLQIVALKIPNNPQVTENWRPLVLSRELRVAHNFAPTLDGSNPITGKPRHRLLVASYEGISAVVADGPDAWSTGLVHPADQTTPDGSRGASEIDIDRASKQVATIEPWHGNQVVVYRPTGEDRNGPTTNSELQREVIDRELRWGHAVRFADLTGDGQAELVVGVRDDPNPNLGDNFTTRRGVRIYRAQADGSWLRTLVDPGNVAVEDLTIADLDRDGQPDIIAVGRQTQNTRIYWNTSQ